MKYLPYGEFLRSLPRKRMAAGALIRNAAGMILLVKPVYKGGWSVPGGVVEADESPKAACVREIREELGLTLPIERMLVVDYNSPKGEKTESLMFIFDGGVLSEAEIAGISLQAEELEAFEFFSPEGLPVLMIRSLRRRLLLALQQEEAQGGVYLEDQEQI
ncbi:MAG: NUDIX hydrolase [Anaerolineaceae bacterium]|nr:NUDIX hydrolase [Anaerolineaceae bacterium]